MEEEAGCFAWFVLLVSSDCCVALTHGSMGLSAVSDCGTYFLHVYISRFNRLENNCRLDSSVGRASAFGAGGRGFESRGRTIPKV